MKGRDGEMIKLTNIKKQFKDKQVLVDMNLKIEEGEIFALIGPNGAGKTTTLRLISGQIKPTSGTLEVLGTKDPEDVKTKIAILNETRTSFSGIKVGDYRTIYRLLYPDFNEKLFNDIIVHYSLSLGERVDKLSAGTKTMLFLALSMASGARVLLLDEPTHNLDPVKKDEVLKLIRNFTQHTEVTVLISSHEIYELEEIITSFAVIREGKILYQDTLDNAKETHRVVDAGETIPEGEIIAHLDNETLVKTGEDIGRYPTFKEIVIGYLRKNVEISLFD